MSKIILLSEIYKLRETKEKELQFYKEKLSELESKLFFLQKEVQLTNFIIDLIEKEKIIDLKDYVNNVDDT
jgi:hypothetical protein